MVSGYLASTSVGERSRGRNLRGGDWVVGIRRWVGVVAWEVTG